MSNHNKKEYNIAPLIEHIETETAPDEIANILDRISFRLCMLEFLDKDNSGENIDAANNLYHLHSLRDTFRKVFGDGDK